VAYQFSTVDDLWTIHLGREFLALSCRRYDRWENFKDHLGEPLRALLEIYAPAFFSRIGLRYRDIIRRSVLGLEGVGWGELLRPHVTGALALPEVAEHVKQATQMLVVGISDGDSAGPNSARPGAGPGVWGNRLRDRLRLFHRG
jgi:uncharacterized protein (TIGR04255 family)